MKFLVLMFLVVLSGCGKNDAFLNDRIVCIEKRKFQLVEHVGDTFFIREIPEACK